MKLGLKITKFVKFNVFVKNSRPATFRNLLTGVPSRDIVVSISNTCLNYFLTNAIPISHIYQQERTYREDLKFHNCLKRTYHYFYYFATVFQMFLLSQV